MKKILIIAITVLASVLIILAQTIEKKDIPKLHNKSKIISPKIIISDGTKSYNLKISAVKVDVKIIGNLAVTNIDITFFNETNRVLEGQLEFPLAENQTISRYAMDINGKLREAVPIEKAKGRKVFEEIVRRGIDPGLLEQTQGNIFRARVYPIPANGYKRIIIGYEEILDKSEDALIYRLPLNFTDSLDKFDFIAQVFSDSDIPKIKNNSLNSNFIKENNYYVIKTQYKNSPVTQPFEFTVPLNNSKDIFIENIDGIRYFNVNFTPKTETQPKPQPQKVGILWDASSSAALRDTNREIVLLESFFSKFSNVNVHLIIFSNDLDKEKDFVIKNGDISEITKELLAVSYDGATQLGKLDLSKYNCDEYLLFSDAMSNFGQKEVNLLKPIYAICSLQKADFPYLTYLSQSSGGRLINLNILSDDKALSMLTEQSLSFISASFNSNEIESVYPSLKTQITNNFSVSGIMKNTATEINLNFGYGNKITYTEKILLNEANDGINSGICGRLWAKKKLAELDVQFDKNKKEITELGKKYSIVTRGTSLIILDRIEDYVRYEISPPEDLKAQYDSIIRANKEYKVINDNNHTNQVILTLKTQEDWWNKTFSIEKKKAVINAKKEAGTAGRSANMELMGSAAPPVSESANANGSGAAAPTTIVAHSNRELVVASDINGTYSNHLEVGSANDDSFDARFSIGSSNNALSDSISNHNPTRTNRQANIAAKISINEYSPTAPYIDELKKASGTDFYQIYLKWKAKYSSSLAFYIDAGDIASKKNINKIALKIYSNLAELDVENEQFLRILAARLRQLKLYEYAIPIYRDLAKMREEEPQSWRDLALTLADNKEYQEAADLMYKVIITQWDGRFPEIEQIALHEFNRILNEAGNLINKDKFDTRFLKNMPDDVRIVLNWDTDNTDIDLWVEDPNGELCGYNHTKTDIGGRISRDFTGGYGPEEFILHRAIKGKYIVKTNYFGTASQKLLGPVTVYLELFTKYGTKEETKQTVMLRLEEVKGWIVIGTLEF
ncbi:MAG: VIT domain-containing protein [Candidatus Kapabacteria bacterium]|nr:VIT domain-containing protein [Candidatus Kapabacteria bacterium]